MVNNKNKRRVVIIGGGPGGYPAAIKAARLGAETILIDRDGIGGTCLHRGCIPTKYLLKTAKEYSGMLEFQRRRGAESFRPDMADIQSNKAQIVRHLAMGTSGLLKKNGVRVVSGTAAFVDRNTVRVVDTGEEISDANFIIATGSRSIRLPVDGIDLPGVMDSDKILEMDVLPGRLVIVGGGYIGLEFAQIFHLFGVEVTVLEMLPGILPNEDGEMSVLMRKILEGTGIDIRTDACLTEIKRSGEKLKVAFDHNAKRFEISADRVLVAVGRKPNLGRLNMEKIGARFDEQQAIEVNRYLETSVPGIYAVGDVVGGLMLAHKASAEGECAACNAVGRCIEMSYEVIPSVMYTLPEMAGVGLTEDQARNRFGEVLIGRFPFSANGRAVLSGAHQGMVKVIADPETECILGATIIGPEAGHLIAEAALAIDMEATLDDVAETVHAHPTLSEAFREAVLDAKGEAIHLAPH